jgi:hypothetical protein
LFARGITPEPGVKLVALESILPMRKSRSFLHIILEIPPSDPFTRIALVLHQIKPLRYVLVISPKIHELFVQAIIGADPIESNIDLVDVNVL